MTLHFITSSQNKFDEALPIFPDVKQLFFDLPEIQSLDSKKIIEFKLSYASAKLPDKKIFVAYFPL